MSTTASKTITRVAPSTTQNRWPMPGAVGKMWPLKGLEEMPGFYSLEEVPELAQSDGKLRGRSLITNPGVQGQKELWSNKSANDRTINAS
jgi:hypothetical protein